MLKRVLSWLLVLCMLFSLMPLALAAEEEAAETGESTPAEESAPEEEPVPEENAPVEEIPAESIPEEEPAPAEEIPAEILPVEEPAQEETVPAETDSVTPEEALEAAEAEPLDEVPETVALEGANTVSGSCGANASWILDRDTGVLTIRGTGAIYDYTPTSYNGAEYPSNPWYTRYNSDIKTIIIEPGITRIGVDAFWMCSCITSVTIPDTVTSIGNRAFTSYQITSVYISDLEKWIQVSGKMPGCAHNLYLNGELVENVEVPEGTNSLGGVFCGCSCLKSITLPESLTSIGDYAFYGCTGLTSITIPENVTSIGDYAFYGCTGLTSITIPSKVTDIADYTFGNCTALKEIYLPDNLKSIGTFAFVSCYALASIELPDNLNSIGAYAFSHCRALTSIELPDNLKSISGSAFRECSGLTSITYPDNVTTDGLSFYGCSSLKSITIPESVTFSTTSIGMRAFQNCSSLTSIVIPEGMTSIGRWCFCGCSSLTSITFPESLTSIYGDAFTGCSSLTSVRFPENVTIIGEFKLQNCVSLTSVTIPNTLTVIADSAFAGCTGLTEIEIPSSVTTIGASAFSGCTGLTSVTIPPSVTTIGASAFHACGNLKAVHISDLAKWAQITFDGGNIYIYESGGCSYRTPPSNPLFYAHNLYLNGELLVELVFPEGTTSISAYAFINCSSMTSVSIPDSVTSIGTAAFSGCTGLTDVTVPGSAASTGAMTFFGCTGLTSVTISKGVTGIGDYAFSDCKGLTSVTISEGVTSIGNYAFRHCKALPGVTIPDSVTSIGKNAFYGCNKLSAVYISDVAAWVGVSFGNEYAVPCCSHELYVNNVRVTELEIPEGITSIGNYAFSGCTGLTGVTIPDSVTSVGSYAFSGCTGLTGVTISEGVTSIGNYAFSGCTGLTGVTIPDSVTGIGQYAFYKCGALRSLTLGSGVRSIGAYAFQDCSSLSAVYVSDADNWARITFSGQPSNPLYYTHKLYENGTLVTRVDIPEDVTAISACAFYGATALEQINVPAGVTSIGSSAFRNCTGLVEINFAAADPSGYDTSMLDGCTNLATIGVPVEATAAYTSRFSSLATKIAAPSIGTAWIVRAGSYSMELAWTKISNASVVGYHVYRGGELIATTAANSYTDKRQATLEAGLKRDTEYTYEICGYSNTDSGVAETEKITLTAATASSPVTSLASRSAVVNLADEQLVALVKDTNGSTEEGIGRFYRKDGEEWVLIASSAGSMSTDGEGNRVRRFAVTWVIGTMSAGDYTLKFVFTDRDNYVTEQEATVTVDPSVPKAVSDLTLAHNAEEGLVFTWTKPADCATANYQVYLRSPDNYRFDYVGTVAVDEETDLCRFVLAPGRFSTGRYYTGYVVGVNQYGYAGEKSNIPGLIAAGKDTEVPIIQAISCESGYKVGSSAAITVKVTDNIGVYRTVFYVSQQTGDEWSEWTEHTTIYSANPSTAYPTEALADGTKLRFKAVCFDAADNQSAESGWVSCEVDHTPPAAPENLHLTMDVNVAVFYWTGDGDAASYTVEYGTSANNLAVYSKDQSGTSLYIDELDPKTTYYFRVKAADSVGNVSEYSEIVSGTTKADTIAPTYSISPANGTIHNNQLFVANARDNVGVKSVEWFYSTDKSTWKKIADAAITEEDVGIKLDTTKFADGPLYVTVKVTDVNGNSTTLDANTACASMTVDNTKPSTPTGLKAVGSSGYVTLSWNAVKTDAAYYAVYYSPTEDGIYQCLQNYISDTRLVVHGLEQGETRYYKVATMDPALNESEPSAAVIGTASEDKTAPKIVSVANTATSAVGVVSETAPTVSILAMDNYCLSSVTVDYAVNDGSYVNLKAFRNLSVYSGYYEVTLPVAECSDGDVIRLKIWATDKSGYYSEEFTADYQVDKTAPAVSSLSAAFSADNKVHLSWTSSNEEDLVGFMLYRQEEGGSEEYIAPIYKGSSEAYTYTDGSITYRETSYTYRLVAIDNVGNMTSDSFEPVSVTDRGKATAVISCDSGMMAGTEYTLSASNSAADYTIVRYDWTIGDQSYSGEEPRHTFDTVGEYNISLTVTDEKGHTDTTTKTVTVSEKKELGLLRVYVRDGNGALLKDADVYFDFNGEGEVVKTTTSCGYVEFTAPAGSYTIAALKGNNEYLPNKLEASVIAGKTKEVEIYLEEAPILKATVTTERLSYEEIIAAGIDVTDPVNQNTVRINIGVSYAGSYSNFTMLKSPSGKKISSSGGGDSDYWRKEISGSMNLTAVATESAVIVMATPTTVTTLKDFFEVSLWAQNMADADPDYTLLDNTFTLNLPESGLSLVTEEGTSGEKSLTVSVPAIRGQEEVTASWLLRGDEIGEYELSVDYAGTLSGFNRLVTANIQSDQKATVVGMQGLELVVEIPEELDHGTLYYNLDLWNNGEYDINFPPADPLDPVINAEYYKVGAEEPAYVTARPTTLSPGEHVVIRYQCQDKVVLRDDKAVESEEGTLVKSSVTTATEELLASWYSFENDENYGLKVRTEVKPLSYFKNRNTNIDQSGRLTMYKGVDTVLTLDTGIVIIGSDAFQDNDTLTEIKISSDVQIIENGAFTDCSRLTTVVLPKGDITIAEGAFDTTTFGSGGSGTIKVYAGSAAEEYCKNNNLNYDSIQEQTLRYSLAVQGDGEAAVLANIQNNAAVNDFQDTNIVEATGEEGAYLEINATAATFNNNCVCTGMTFNVTPRDADGNEISNAGITDSPITFRVPVDSTTTLTQAAVYHENELIGVFEVQTDEGGNKYIEISSTQFSEYRYELGKDTTEAETDSLACALSLSLMDCIDVNFYLKPAEGKDVSDYTVMVTYKGKTATYYAEDGTYVSDTQEYRMVIASCAVKEVFERLHIEVLCDGVSVKNKDYSVYDYCCNMLRSDDDELQELCRTMLDYGSYARTFFGYTETVAAGSWTARDVSSVDIPENRASVSGGCSGLTAESASLTLTSRTAINYYFVPDAGKTADDFVFMQGETVLPATTLSDSSGVVSILVTLSGIKATELNGTYTVTAQSKDSESEGTLSVTYSPMTYAYNKSSTGDTDLSSLCRALYKYYTAAVTYFRSSR